MTRRDTTRKATLTKRAALSDSEQQTASHAATERFLSSPLYQNSQHIGFYLAHQRELDPAAIMTRAQQDGKFCYLPTLDPISDNRLLFVRYNAGESLVKNQYHILEPVIKPNNVIGARRLDCVLVPLVSFDEHGQRLGMGKGYYDRTFAFKNNQSAVIKPLLVGFAYEFQQCPSLNAKSWDVPMDYVVTDQRIYEFSNHDVAL